MNTGQPIHQDQPVMTFGPPLAEARAAVVLVHGRGSTAGSILQLAQYLPQEGITYLAPQAAGGTWYPNSGFIPLVRNEPFVSSAFETLSALLEQINTAGIPYEKIAIGGFSQGGCLTSEFVARNPRRYGGLYVFSGALMGPPDMERDYPGSLAGLPVFIGGGSQDPWVSEGQMKRTGDVLQRMGGVVELDIQPSAEHTIRPNEIAAVQLLAAGLTAD